MFYTSWRYWYTKGELHRVDDCKTCNGDLEVKPDDLKFKVYCHCEMYRWQRTIQEKYRPYQSLCRPTSLGNLRTPVGGQRAQSNWRKVVERIDSFIKNPVGWILLMGTFGSGKTHLLRSIHTAVPVTLYLDCSDFQNAIFSVMKNGNLSAYINKIKRAPILLLDDIGLEWKNEFTFQKLLDVINFRYKYPNEFPTIATTNFFFDNIDLQKKQSLTKGRFWSRMTDANVVEGIPVLAGDYRSVKHGR